MTDMKEKVREEMDGLRQLRDELRVQMELGKAEARDRWDKLEDRWHHLEAKARQLREASRDDLEDVGQAARLLLDEIRAGYQHLRRML